MLAAERASGLRAAVAFAAGAMTWNGVPEIRERLIRAAQKSTVPIFLLQAENDYSVAPSLTLASELERAGKPYKMQIFPAYGTTHQDGHGGFCVRGGDSWGAAVLEFLDANLSSK
jgi:pimeloyl-ACP methyl ester carboxylesterase